MLYPQNIQLGALFILLSELMFASMTTPVNAVSIELPNGVIVFLHNLMGLGLLSIWFWHKGFSRLKTRVIHLHLLRASFGLAAMYCFFYAPAISITGTPGLYFVAGAVLIAIAGMLAIHRSKHKISATLATERTI